MQLDRRRLTIIAISALAGLAALAACQDATPPPPAPRPVRTMVVDLRDRAETISQTGEIQPRYESDLGFQINGRVARRYVDVGALVKPGDVLATLDDSDVANELKAAEAEALNAQASAQVALAAFRRQKQLFDKKIAAQAALENAEAVWKSAEAKQQAAIATRENAVNRRKYAELVATEAGVVTAIGANRGQVVGAGQMVARVASVDARDAVFAVPERLIGGAAMGMTVHVGLVADPIVTTVGTLREISPAADPVTRSYRVRVTLPNAPAAMTLGATINGAVTLSNGRMIVVPGSAITSSFGAPAVFVVDPNTARLILQPVMIARYEDGVALIRSGLRAGDRVVTAGVSKLRPDETVKLEPAP